MTKSKKSAPCKTKHMAEGGMALKKRLPLKSETTGGMMSDITRKAHGYPDQKRSINDTPDQMRRNREALKKKK